MCIVGIPLVLYTELSSRKGGRGEWRPILFVDRTGLDRVLSLPFFSSLLVVNGCFRSWLIVMSCSGWSVCAVVDIHLSTVAMIGGREGRLYT